MTLKRASVKKQKKKLVRLSRTMLDGRLAFVTSLVYAVHPLAIHQVGYTFNRVLGLFFSAKRAKVIVAYLKNKGYDLAIAEV